MAKKEFNGLSGAAMAYITPEQTKKAPKQAERGKAPTATPERKTQRIGLILRPSVVAGLRKVAAMERTTVNDLIDRMAAQYVAAHIDLIQKYNKIFKEDK